MNNNKKENIIIIGGGPAGLSASIYLARAGLKPLVIAGSPAGGQLTLTSEVENYPGFSSILGPKLIESMRQHAAKFDTRFINDNVKQVDFSDKNNLKIFLTNKKFYLAKSILITTGALAVWLGLESEQRLKGKGVSACATCDGFFFRDKIVAVVGGGDTAMEEALTLSKFASSVYIIHRRNQFRASKIMQERVFKNQKIKVIWDAQVVEVLGENKVEGLKLKTENPQTNQKLDDNKILKVDGVFIAIGHLPSTNFLNNSGVLLDEKGYIITTQRYAIELLKLKSPSFAKALVGKQNSNFKSITQSLKPENFDTNYQSSTSVKGVFAAGDCVDYIYRQAGTAVGMGISAALEIEKFLENL